MNAYPRVVALGVIMAGHLTSWAEQASEPKAPPTPFIKVADWFYEAIFTDVRDAERDKKLVAKALYYNCVEAKQHASEVITATKAGIEDVLEFGKSVLQFKLKEDYIRRASNYYNIARDAQAKEEYAEAAECYMRAIFYNGQFWQAYDYLADIFLNPLSGFYSPQRAFLMSRLGLMVQPREPSLHHSYVRSLLHLKNYSQALSASDRGMALSTWETAGREEFRVDRGRCRLVSLKAQALWGSKEADKARKYFEMAVQLDRFNDVAWVKSFLDGTRKVGELGYGVAEEVPGTGALEVSSSKWPDCFVSFLGETKVLAGGAIRFRGIPAGEYVLEGWHEDDRLSGAISIRAGSVTKAELDFYADSVVDREQREKERGEAYAKAMADAQRGVAANDRKLAEQAILRALRNKPLDDAALKLLGDTGTVPPHLFANRKPMLVKSLERGFLPEDKRGFQWQIQSDGAVICTAPDYGFQVYPPYVGGGAVGGQIAHYSADGDEVFIHSGEVKGISVAQQVYVDREKAFCRWVLTLRSTGKDAPKEVDVVITTALGQPPEKAVIAPFPNAPDIQPDATTHIVTGRVIHWACGKNEKLRPQVKLEGSGLSYRYKLAMNPGQEIRLIYIVARRANFEEAKKAAQALTAKDFFSTLDARTARAIDNWH